MQDFTEGPITKQVVSFSIPLLMGNFLQTFSSMITAMFVGKILGEEALAATTTCMPILFLFISLLMGIALATNILMAQAYGMKDLGIVRKVMANSFLASTFLCILVTLVSLIFAGDIIALFRTPTEVRPLATLFFRIIAAGLLIQFLFNWYSGLLRGLGNSKIPLYTLLISTVFTVILVPFFIIILKIGIVGAGLGAIIANLIGLIWGYFYSVKKYPIFDMRTWDYKPDWQMLKKMVIVGFPATLQMMVTSFAGALILGLVNSFDNKDLTAAAGAGMQIDQIAFLPAMTIGMAISSMIGQNFAIGKFDRIKKILTSSLLLSVAISVILNILIYIFAEPLGHLFNNKKETIAFSTEYLRIVSFTYIAYSLMFAFQGVIRGAGATMASLMITTIAVVGFRIPLSWYLSQHTTLQETGIWWGILLSTLVGVLLSWGYYLLGGWKKMRLMEKRDPKKSEAEAETLSNPQFME